jgi:mannose-6-phosphate isomerase
MQNTERSNHYMIFEKGMRPWGQWQVLDSGLGFCVKKIEVEPGHRLSLQYHHHRSEHWLVIEGEAKVEINGHALTLVTCQHVHIPLHAAHRITNTGTSKLVILELQQGDILDENDIVRLADDYSRV